jgi:ABC-2 type transport system permease protein
MRASETYEDGRASRTVVVTTAKRAARGGGLWGIVFGATIAATMSQYPSLFPTSASRAAVAASVQGNIGFQALFGPVHRIDTVAGYTAYKTMYTLLVLGAIWGLLVATRVLRGEEDAGRWEVLLSGRTTRGGAALQASIGLGTGVIALWLPTTVLAAAAGAGSKVNIGLGAALFFATSAVAAAAMFMAIGMLCSQLFATRHDANMAGAGILAASYMVRMVADSAASLAWLRWASPLGWIEELRPLTGSRPLAFMPIVALTGILVVVAVRVADARDVGGSVFAGRDRREGRRALLEGQAGLTARLTRPAIIVWLAAFVAVGLVFGLVTQAAGRAARGSPSLERAVARLGGRSAGNVAYLGLIFVIVAGLVAIAVTGQVVAIRNEEASGRLDNLLVRPVAMWRWLCVRLGLGIGFVVLASVLTGVAAWVGATTQHTGVAIADMVKAGLNVAPPALFILGIGGLVYGLAPRVAIGFTYGLVVWSFLVETIASIVKASHWLRDTSPLAHITPAPAAPPNWTSAAFLVLFGVLAGLAGIVAFSRRDVQGA